jgi:hypothetical protein
MSFRGRFDQKSVERVIVLRRQGCGWVTRSSNEVYGCDGSRMRGDGVAELEVGADGHTGSGPRYQLWRPEAS